MIQGIDTTLQRAHCEHERPGFLSPALGSTWGFHLFVFFTASVAHMVLLVLLLRSFWG
jgi:hypothetical protein